MTAADYLFVDVSGIKVSGKELPAREVAKGIGAGSAMRAEDAAFVAEAVAERSLIPLAYGNLVPTFQTVATSALRVYDGSYACLYGVQKLASLFRDAGVVFLDPLMQDSFSKKTAADLTTSPPVKSPFCAVAERYTPSANDQGDGTPIWGTSVTCLSPIRDMFASFYGSPANTATPSSASVHYATNFFIKYGLANFADIASHLGHTTPPCLPNCQLTGGSPYPNLVMTADTVRAACYIIGKLTRTIQRIYVTSDSSVMVTRTTSTGKESTSAVGPLDGISFTDWESFDMQMFNRLTGNVHLCDANGNAFPATVNGKSMASSVHLYGLGFVTSSDMSTETKYWFDLGDITSPIASLDARLMMSTLGISGSAYSINFFATVDWAFPATPPAAWTWTPTTA